MTDPIRCPACSREMLEEDFGSARVDVCAQGCQGIWLDGGELERLDSRRKGAGPALERALSQEPAAARAGEPVDCPRCATPLQRMPHGLLEALEIDACAACGGVFLEGGELARLRSRPLRPEEREEIRERRRRAAQRRARPAVGPGTWLGLDLLDVVLLALWD